MRAVEKYIVAFFGLIAPLSMGACGSVRVKYATLNSPPHAVQPVAPEKVEIFTTGNPTRKYVEIGTVTAMHDSIASNDDMFKAMRGEAGKRGCDGLVVTQRGVREAIASCVVYSE